MAAPIENKPEVSPVQLERKDVAAAQSARPAWQTRRRLGAMLPRGLRLLVRLLLSPAGELRRAMAFGGRPEVQEAWRTGGRILVQLPDDRTAGLGGWPWLCRYCRGRERSRL